MPPKDVILAKEGGTAAIEAKGTPNFATVATTDMGMYAAEDDYGTSYCYRGAVQDNWVQFGTDSSGQALYWRIIRINGDATIRLIYNGISTAQTGDSTMISTEEVFNSGWNDNMYVGYMYTNGQLHGLGTNSDIKTTIDNWYASNLADEAEYLEGSTGFCGDRTIDPTSSGTGIGTSATDYAAYHRLVSNKAQILTCPDKQDLYTTSGSSTVNAALQYPVGLITADEATFAGTFPWSGNNNNNYLKTGRSYWTMSSYHGFHAYVFYVAYSGSMGGYYVDETFEDSYGVRPVINLRADIEITGSGTTSDPFRVVGAS